MIANEVKSVFLTDLRLRHRLLDHLLHNVMSRIAQHLRDKELWKACKEEPHHIMTEIRNDHLPPTSKCPDQLLRKLFSPGANEAWGLAIHLGLDWTEVDIHEGDGFVVWSIEPFVSVKSQDDSAIKVFGGGVEDDSGHGRFVGEGSHEHNEGWTSAGGRTKGWKEGPGQEEGVGSDLDHVLFLGPFVEPMG